MSFELKAVQVQVITTSDGKEFSSMEEAQAHQFAIENAEAISGVVDSYLNTRGMKNRNRKQKEGVASDVIGFLISQGVDLSGVKAVERTVFDDVVEKAEATATDATEAPADPTSSDGKELF